MKTKITKYIVLTVALAVGILIHNPLTVDAQDESPNDLLVIANKNLKANKVSVATLRAVFLKKKTTIGSSRVIPINSSASSSARKAFRKKVLGMSGPEEADYWEDQKIKAGTTEPASFSNSVKAVYKVKGGVSYCYRKNYNAAAAKILAVL